jgi:hypothetical protein
MSIEHLIFSMIAKFCGCAGVKHVCFLFYVQGPCVSTRPYEPIKISLCASGYLLTNEPYKNSQLF